MVNAPGPITSVTALILSCSSIGFMYKFSAKSPVEEPAPPEPPAAPLTGVLEALLRLIGAVVVILISALCLSCEKAKGLSMAEASDEVLTFRRGLNGNALFTHNSSIRVQEVRFVLEKRHHIPRDSVDFVSARYMGENSMWLEDNTLLVPPDEVCVVMRDPAIAEFRARIVGPRWFDVNLRGECEAVRGDFTCVLRAVEFRPEQFQFATPELRQDKTTIIAALRQMPLLPLPFWGANRILQHADLSRCDFDDRVDVALALIYPSPVGDRRDISTVFGSETPIMLDLVLKFYFYCCQLGVWNWGQLVLALYLQEDGLWITSFWICTGLALENQWWFVFVMMIMIPSLIGLALCAESDDALGRFLRILLKRMMAPSHN